MLILSWLIVGAVFYVLSMWKDKYGFKYASYAGFTIALFLTLGVMRNDDSWPYVTAQVIFFFMATGVWAFTLRDKVKKGAHGQGKDFEEKIIGQTVQAGDDGINSVSGGEVLWAGKTLKARLAKNIDVDIVEAGTQLIVREVIGDTLIVTPKN